MVTSADHYEVLEVDDDASERDVKRAFYRLLKENPPEQKPKEYQRLREAYDVLSDPVARKEYDSMSSFGEEIEALRKEAEGILNDEVPDFDEAERLLKKAVVLGPDIGMLRNLLGRCFLRTERAEAALKQFDRAVDINPKNESYLLNKGAALEELERYEEAKQVYRDVWEMDTEDYAAPRALAAVLHKTGWEEEAHNVLDRAIEADGQVDFQDFFCIYDKVHFYLFDGEHDRLREQLDRVVRVARSPADKQFASFMLARSGASLFDIKAYSLAKDFVEAARKLDVNDEFVEGLAAATTEASDVSDGVMAVIEDDNYHPIASELVRIRGGLYLRYMEEVDAQKQFGEVLGVLDNVMDTDPDASEIKTSFRRLRDEHPAVFEIGSELYTEILQSPAATKFRKPCPHCGEKVTAPKGDYSVGGCPFCNQPLRLRGNQFEKVGSSRSYASSGTGTGTASDEGLPGWVWVVGIIFLLIMMSNC